MDKAPDAFRTISEVGDELDIPQHVLRFWETRFSQIKPMKRSGGRRFYRPDDVDLLRGIRRLLYGEGYTIRGVQRILKEQGVKSVQALGDSATDAPALGPIDAERATAKEPDIFDEAATFQEPPAFVAPQIAAPPRRTMATPLPRVGPVPRDVVATPAATAAPAAAQVGPIVESPRSDKRPLDIDRLKAALADLVACRQLLDRALHEG